MFQESDKKGMIRNYNYLVTMVEVVDSMMGFWVGRRCTAGYGYLGRIPSA